MKSVLGALGRASRSPMGVRPLTSAIGFLGLLAGFGGSAMAHFGPGTPEIDPGSMVNALLVLSGSLLIVTGRRPRK